VVVLGPGGAALGRLVCDLLPGARLYGPRSRPGARADDYDEVYDRVMALFAELFAAGRPIVGLCASGILVRAVAPLIDNKTVEPPVVVVLSGGNIDPRVLARILVGETP